MKKIILFVIMTMVFSMASCQNISEIQPDNPTDGQSIGVYEIGSNIDDMTYGNHQYDCYECYDGLFTDPNAEQNITISFESQDYQGTYLYSENSVFANYQSDHYSFDGGDFIVNNKTKELVDFVRPVSLEYPDYYLSLEQATVSLEQATETCNNFINKMIHSDDYRIETKEYDAFYCFHFTRYCNDIKTAESVNVGISRFDGTVMLFSSRMMNEFDSETLTQFSDFLKRYEGQFDELIESKVNDIYSDCKGYLGYEVEDTVLCKLQDGGCGIAYYVDISLCRVDEDGHPETGAYGEKIMSGERICLLIK